MDELKSSKITRDKYLDGKSTDHRPVMRMENLSLKSMSNIHIKVSPPLEIYTTMGSSFLHLCGFLKTAPLQLFIQVSTFLRYCQTESFLFYIQNQRYTLLW